MDAAAALVPGGIVLALFLAWAVVVLAAEEPMSNPQTRIAASIRFEALGHDADIASLERGRSYYAQLCIGCHGARGDGLGEWAYRVHPRPADLRAQRVARRSDQQLYETLRDGIPGTPMSGWKDRLTPTQLRQVVLYVRHLALIGGRS